MSGFVSNFDSLPATEGDVSWKGDVLFKTVETGHQCIKCKKPSQWISLSFEAALCSTDCLDQAWDEVLYASNHI